MDDELADDFEQLVSYVVEIGLVDMYGATTDEPLEMLARAVDLLQRRGVGAPLVHEVFEARGEEHVRGWGPAVTRGQTEHVRRWCLNESG